RALVLPDVVDLRADRRDERVGPGLLRRLCEGRGRNQRGGERGAGEPHHLYERRMRAASACESFIACSGVLVPVSAAWMPSFNALVTRWLSCVESSATEYCSWSRATAATGKPFTYSCIFVVCHASGRTAT